MNIRVYKQYVKRHRRFWGNSCDGNKPKASWKRLSSGQVNGNSKYRYLTSSCRKILRILTMTVWYAVMAGAQTVWHLSHWRWDGLLYGTSPMSIPLHRPIYHPLPPKLFQRPFIDWAICCWDSRTVKTGNSEIISLDDCLVIFGRSLILVLMTRRFAFAFANA